MKKLQKGVLAVLIIGLGVGIYFFVLSREPKSFCSIVVAEDFEKVAEYLNYNSSTFKFGSMKEILGWLRGQSCVGNLFLTGPLIETNPPQIEIKIEFILSASNRVTKLLDVILLDFYNENFVCDKMSDLEECNWGSKFKFRELHN